MNRSVADFVHQEMYAQALPALGRLETYEETVARSEEMHLAKFPGLPKEAVSELEWAFNLVRQRRVLPAMRSMQYGGPAVFKHNARLYNTWAAHCDYPRVFAEALYLLMCGSGIGFSVQRHHVARLPRVAPTSGSRCQALVADSIEGWASALELLVRSYFQGFAVTFDTSAIRPLGAPLGTSFGRAPGPAPFRILEDRFRRVFESARGRCLHPIECYDLFCYAAEAAATGGAGRSAMLCVFSADDTAMLAAKTGRYYETAPWRRMSNNSVALLRGQSDRAKLADIFDRTKEWGEPGVFFVQDLDVCSNSCVEVGFYPKLEVCSEHLARLRPHHPDATAGQVLSGFQGATLTEINGSRLHSAADFIESARAAAIINTLQAAYTSFPFLGPVAELLCERDAMLGVGITGMMARPDICFDPVLQKRAAAEVVRTNQSWAALLGIRTASRTTLIKPSGKTSLILGCVSNGIHPYHARRYFLRLRSRPGSQAFDRFKAYNPHQCTQEAGSGYVVFPLESPEGAICRDTLDAVQHLGLIRSTLQSWVVPGCTGAGPATHNVSNTVSVRKEEWPAVQDYIFRHQDILGGVALLGHEGEHQHPQAPLVSVVGAEAMAVWSRLLREHCPVDYAAPEEPKGRAKLGMR